MDMYEEIKTLVGDLGDATVAMKGDLEARIAAERKEREDLEKRLNRGGLHTGGDAKAETAAEIEYKAAFLSWARNGDDSNLRALEAKAMSAGSGPDGGFAVPEHLDLEIEKYLLDQSAMRSIARIVPGTSSDYKKLINTGGTASGWVGEHDSRPTTASPTFELVTIEAAEVYANPAVTQKLLDDAGFDVAGFLTEEIGEALAAKEGDAFLNGNGVGKPRGLLTYTTSTAADATRASGVIQYVASGAAGAFPTTSPADKLIQLAYSLRKGYRKNAAWLMSGNTIETVRKFKDGMGQYIWRNGDSLLGQPDSLLGYPIAEDEYMPDIGADEYAIAFGDFRRAYYIIDRKGIRILQDPYTNKPNVNFYATKRVGGGLISSQAVKLMKMAAS